MEYMGAWVAACPYFGENSQPADRYVPLALLLLDLVRSETDSQPEGVIAGAGMCLNWMVIARASMATALWNAGFLDVCQATMQRCVNAVSLSFRLTFRFTYSVDDYRYNAMERISQENLIPTGVLAITNAVVSQAQASGIDVIQPLVDAGAVDMVISTLTAYQMLGKPEATSVASIQWGALFTLETLLASDQAQLIVDKLRSAGVDSFRYLLDHPLVLWADVGAETGNQATSIAALVWGRDDDGAQAGLRFQQQDIDKIVEVKGHRGAAGTFYPMLSGHGQSILSLSVSENNKELLLASKGFIPLLVDSLLLDPAHPRMENATIMGVTDWDAAKGAFPVRMS